MLGGQNPNLRSIPQSKKLNDFPKSSDAIPETVKEKKAEMILKNMDDVIEFVVNDISGTATGIDMANKTPDHQYKFIKNLLLRHRAFSKPAPASRKKLMQLKYQKSSGELFDCGHMPQYSSYDSSVAIDDSINDTISRVIYQTIDCSVSTVDLFLFSPLSNVICTGCFRKFDDKESHPVDSGPQECLR